MIQFTETYTWKQAATMSKLEKLQVVLKMILFTVESNTEDVYYLSQKAAMEGMIYFANRIEDDWQSRKEYFLTNFPKFNFEKRQRIRIEGEPTGEEITFENFIGFYYKNEKVNIHDYRATELAYALLEPPYGLNLKIDHERGTPEYDSFKTKEFSNIYRMFLDNFILLSEYKKEDLVVYRWSDDWSNFFDAGKEWWGTYYWTVFNKQNHTVIVLGASETD